MGLFTQLGRDRSALTLVVIITAIAATAVIISTIHFQTSFEGGEGGETGGREGGREADCATAAFS